MVTRQAKIRMMMMMMMMMVIMVMMMLMMLAILAVLAKREIVHAANGKVCSESRPGTIRHATCQQNKVFPELQTLRHIKTVFPIICFNKSELRKNGTSF